MNAAATAATETAEALAVAATIARQAALDVALERESEWRMQAMARLHGERRSAGQGPGRRGSEGAAFQDAGGEVALSSSSEARDGRPKLGRLVDGPGLDALRAWAATPPLADLQAQPEGAAAS